MGQINLPTNILDRVKRVEDQISRLWKAVGLSSATIASGGLTLLNNAFLKMLGPTDNEIVYIGPDPDTGEQVIRIRDADGHLIFGNVSGGTGGQRVAINPSPAGAARIEFYDDASTTDRVSLSMAGANFVQQREAQDGSGINGGKVSFYQGKSYFGHQTATNDMWLQFTDDERIWMRGRWSSQNTETGRSALYVGAGSLGAGPITLVVSYGATMAGTMRVIATRQGPLADSYFAVTVSSATGFEITTSGGSSTTFNYWSFRT